MSDTDLSQQTSLDDNDAMIGVAKRRGIVRLADGTLATLVAWGISRGGRREPSRARFEGCDGETRWTGRKADVIEVVQ